MFHCNFWFTFFSFSLFSFTLCLLYKMLHFMHRTPIQPKITFNSIICTKKRVCDILLLVMMMLLLPLLLLLFVQHFSFLSILHELTVIFHAIYRHTLCDPIQCDMIPFTTFTHSPTHTICDRRFCVNDTNKDEYVKR